MKVRDKLKALDEEIKISRIVGNTKKLHELYIERAETQDEMDWIMTPFEDR